MATTLRTVSELLSIGADPGAIPTETEFFDRAGMWTRKSAQDDPASVARTGFEAMLNGEGDIVMGWMNKLQTVIANVTPSAIPAEPRRRQAEPRSALRR